MNCRGWAPHIALFVAGDLENDLARQLEQHLLVCAECHQFADELRASRSAVHELRAETVEASSLNRVRANVLAQVRAIEERRTWIDRAGMWLWGGLRWRYAVLGSVVLALLAIAIWSLSHPAPLTQIANTVPTVEPAPVPPSNSTQPEPAASVKRTVAHRVLPKPVEAEPPVVLPVVIAEVAPPVHEDTVVQFLTDDPNVVILWLIDQTGGK